MALIQMTFVSHALMRAVPVQVILPSDKWNPDGTLQPVKKFKTLYLLHGLWGQCTDWVTGTRIQRWAEERDLAVVMPSGDNSFYVDRPASNNLYGEFIGRELVEMTRRMFPLSERKEDTFIGGLSMGGYGAMRNGLKYHDTFSAIAALSPALHIFEGMAERAAVETRAFGEAIFGDLELAAKSDKNPRVLVENLTGKKELPKIYLACGTGDDLLPASRIFRDLMPKAGFDVTYFEGPGRHDWDFWDEQIRLVLDWLPLDDRSQGLNSGHVK